MAVDQVDCPNHTTHRVLPHPLRCFAVLGGEGYRAIYSQPPLDIFLFGPKVRKGVAGHEDASAHNLHPWRLVLLGLCKHPSL